MVRSSSTAPVMWRCPRLRWMRVCRRSSNVMSPSRQVETSRRMMSPLFASDEKDHGMTVPQPSRRRVQDRLAERSFLIVALSPIALVLIMIVALALRSRPIVASRPIGDLLSGETWLPLQGQFGFAPFIVGTLWVTLTTMVIAVPVCILCALYLSEYAGPRLRGMIKPLLDILAAIPSVIYGVWGLLAIVPFVQYLAAPVLQQLLGFIPFFHSDNPT